MTPEQVAEACTAHVFSSDLIVALPASSFGTHYEVGVAVGYGLPAILLIPNEESTSYIMEGLAVHSSVHALRFGSREDLAERMRLKISELASKLKG